MCPSSKHECSGKQHEILQAINDNKNKHIQITTFNEIFIHGQNIRALVIKPLNLGVIFIYLCLSMVEYILGSFTKVKEPKHNAMILY